MNEVQLLIGGQSLAASSGLTFERANPISGSTVSRAAAATVDDANPAARHINFTGCSGVGRFGGQSGIDAFTHLRWITIETQTPHYPF
jgi:acyl-CoA reductase-like NAD-dependent aldehyde dehydrogenase